MTAARPARGAGNYRALGRDGKYLLLRRRRSTPAARLELLAERELRWGEDVDLAAFGSEVLAFALEVTPSAAGRLAGLLFRTCHRRSCSMPATASAALPAGARHARHAGAAQSAPAHERRSACARCRAAAAGFATPCANCASRSRRRLSCSPATGLRPGAVPRHAELRLYRVRGRRTPGSRPPTARPHCVPPDREHDMTRSARCARQYREVRDPAPTRAGAVAGCARTAAVRPAGGRARARRLWSIVWLIFGFHATAAAGWKPTVRPPRLGGNARLSVFAPPTFRPIARAVGRRTAGIAAPAACSSTCSVPTCSTARRSRR